MMQFSLKTLFTFMFLMNVLFMSATETQLVVRVKAKDAKFIGSSLGGAYVIIRDAQTDEILAQGKTEGSTGNTKQIMNLPHERGRKLSDASTAKFLATIDIDEPTFVTIEAFSPSNNKQAQVHASTQLWLIPGKDILGDGVVIEISGFIIDILEPRTHQYISLASIANKPFKFKANIVMMCGCTIDKGGIWDSEKMEVKAIVKLNGSKVSEVPLNCISTNLFEGELFMDRAGEYEIIVYAYASDTGNTGVDSVNYIIY